MTEVMDYNDSYSDAEAFLDDTADNINKAHGKLSEFLESVANAKSPLEETSGPLKSSFESLQSLILNNQQSLDENFKETAKVGDDLTQSIQQAAEDINKIIEEIDSEENKFVSQLTERQSHLVTEIETVRDMAAADIEKAKLIQENLKITKSNIFSVVDTLNETNQDLTKELENTLESVNHDFENRFNDIQLVLNEHLEDIISPFIDNISDLVPDNLEKNLLDSKDVLNQRMELFEDSAQKLVKTLISDFQNISNNVCNYCRDSVEEAVSRIFAELIDTAIEALLSEITENIALMQIGTATTSMLSSIMPELIAAKATVEVIKTTRKAAKKLDPTMWGH